MWALILRGGVGGVTAQSSWKISQMLGVTFSFPKCFSENSNQFLGCDPHFENQGYKPLTTTKSIQSTFQIRFQFLINDHFESLRLVNQSDMSNWLHAHTAGISNNMFVRTRGVEIHAWILVHLVFTWSSMNINEYTIKETPHSTDIFKENRASS